MAFHMPFLSLDFSQKDSRLTVFLTKGERVFQVSILSLFRSRKGFASGRLSYGKASTYRPYPTYYVTVLVFVCTSIPTTLTHDLMLHIFQSQAQEPP